MRCSIAFLSSVLALGMVAVEVVIPGTALAATAPASDPAALLARFAGIPGLQAHYREEKRMALLAEPLVSEGTIHYVRPGRLARHQHTPERVSVIIGNDKLEFGGAHGKESVDLAKNPIVRLFVDSFVDVLSGDRKSLEQTYHMKFSVTDAATARWKLVLKPRVEPMTKMIQSITMEGRDVVLDSMEILEIGGDSTRMTFTQVNAARRYSKKEQRELFRLPR